jgi:diadenosine tetraphosphate (Ap4A) HIT family hydrolase
MGEKLKDAGAVQKPYPFCSTDGALLPGPLAYVRPDKFPVTPCHRLVNPVRHETHFFAINPSELDAIWDLVAEAKAVVDAKDHLDGYNLGINVGEVAGETVAHAHLHVIRRYRGDVENPRGGVRGVIPAMQHY